MFQNDKSEEPKFFNGALKMNILDKNHPDINNVLLLYYSAFPKNELIDFNAFYSPRFKSDVISIYDNNQFVGFAVILTKNNISNIMYFAIEPNLRGKGYGTQSLKQISEYYKNNKIILDVEDPFECNNEREREKRLKRIYFYTRAGFKLTNIKYEWGNEFYVIMINKNADLSEKEFWEFWKLRK